MAAIDDLRSVRHEFERLNRNIISDERSLRDVEKRLRELIGRGRKLSSAEVEKEIKTRRRLLRAYKQRRDKLLSEAADLVEVMKESLDYSNESTN